jgi:predicted dinucleotide-binding enzyme
VKAIRSAPRSGTSANPIRRPRNVRAAPARLRSAITELGPNARAATVADAAKAGEIVVVSIPLKHYRTVPVEPLAGKIVIDTNNYYPQRDGQITELDNESTTTAELLQAHLPTSKVVKAFNHIYAAQLTTDGRPTGTPNRRALVIAGDDPSAKTTVTRLPDEFGFDTVDAGPLKEGCGAFSAIRPAMVPGARPKNCVRTLRQPSGTRINSRGTVDPHADSNDSDTGVAALGETC